MPVAPLENCPDVEDCLADPSEIRRICTFAPLCGTCAVYRVIEGRRGLLLGTCRIRTERGEFPCTAPISDSYLPRAGAQPARIVPLAHGPRPRHRPAGAQVGGRHGRAQTVRSSAPAEGAAAGVAVPQGGDGPRSPARP